MLLLLVRDPSYQMSRDQTQYIAENESNQRGVEAR